MNSNYDALSGGVSAWGLGGMGAVRRGGFGSSGALGGVLPRGALLDENGNPIRDENNQIITDETGS